MAYTTKQKTTLLSEIKKLTSAGTSIAAACKQVGIRSGTYDRWTAPTKATKIVEKRADVPTVSAEPVKESYPTIGEGDLASETPIMTFTLVNPRTKQTVTIVSASRVNFLNIVEVYAKEYA